MAKKKLFILAIIPARGGSKGIPRKNIKLIAGKPLIAWTIEAAKASKLLSRFVVSTDDAEIAEISSKYGAEVIDRPAKLAADNTITADVLKHVLSIVPADIVVVLQPSSPIRDEGLIDACLTKFFESETESLATGFVCKFREWGSPPLRRQDINGFFYDDGNVYIMTREFIDKNIKPGLRDIRFEIDREQNVEIDDHFDFWLAEQILLKRSHENER